MLSQPAIPSDLQVEALGYLVQDAAVMARFHSVIVEEVFENPVHRVIYSIARRFFLKFNRCPSRRVLEKELEGWLRERADKQLAPVEFFWREVSKVYSVTTNERSYLTERLMGFIVRHRLARLADSALVQARADSLDLDVITREVRSLYNVMGGVFEEKKEYLLKDAESRSRENPAMDKIPTGLPTLDSYLGGGLGPGELGVVMAPTGRGKSFFLSFVGANALRVRKRVLHFTLELSKDKVLARYESYQTKIRKSELFTHSSRVERVLKRMRRLVQPADVLVVEFPTKSLTIDQMRAVILQVSVSEDFSPDMVVVDYADLLKPVKGVDMGDRKHEILTSLYERLRGLAQELKVPIWTGSQTTRVSLSKETVTIADISESFGKAMVADVIIALCSTRDEMEKSCGRFFIDKNRDNRGHVIIPYEYDFDTAAFREIEGAKDVSVVEVDYSSPEEYDDDIPF